MSLDNILLDLKFSKSKKNPGIKIAYFSKKDNKTHTATLFCSDVNSIDEAKFEINFPFSKFDDEIGPVQSGPVAELDEILSCGNAGTFDIEVEHWRPEDPKNPEIYQIGFAANSRGEIRKYIFTKYFPGDTLFLNYPGPLERTNVIFCKTQQEIVEKFVETVRSENVTRLRGHNILSYDHVACREFPKQKKSQKIYKIGIDDSEPTIRPTVGGKNYEDDESAFVLRNTKIFGIHNIDTMLKYWLWSNDHTLETVAKFADFKFKKSLNYGEQDFLLEKARNGDRDASEKLAEYCMGDVMIEHALGDSFERVVLNLAKEFKTTPGSITVVSKGSLARNLFDRCYFAKTGETRNPRNFEMRNYNHNKQKLKLLRDNKIYRAKRGLFENSKIVYFSLAHIFRDVIENMTNTNLFDILDKTIDYIEKPIYAQATDALSEEILFDLEQTKKEINPLSAEEFKERYGIHTKSAKQRIKKFAENLESVLAETDSKVVNNTTKFLVIASEKPEKLDEKLKDIGSLVPVQTANVISCKTGRVIAKTPRNLFYWGLALSETKALKTAYELETIETYVGILFELGVVAAENYAVTRENALSDEYEYKDVSKEDLLFSISQRLELNHYPRKYKKSLKYAILKELQLYRGKKAQFGYAYVGAEKPRALIASEFLSDNIVPHREAYYEQCFGEKSLLTDVRNSVTKKTKQTKLL